MAIERWRTGMHFLSFQDYIDLEKVSFTEEEIQELRNIDPRLIVEQEVGRRELGWQEAEFQDSGRQEDSYNYLALDYDDPIIRYYSLGHNWYAAFIDKCHEEYDEIIQNRCIFFVFDQFDALKEKVIEYMYINF